jgi:hypothetical protein
MDKKKKAMVGCIAFTMSAFILSFSLQVMFPLAWKDAQIILWSPANFEAYVGRNKVM